MKVPTETVLKSRLERGRWDSEVRRWERLRGGWVGGGGGVECSVRRRRITD